jgi:hypothetical protein
MEAEIITYNGENEKEVVAFFVKHGKRIFDKHKEIYLKKKEEEEKRKEEIRKKAEEEMEKIRATFSETPSGYLFMGTSSTAGSIEFSGTPGRSPYEGDFCYSYYVQEEVIQPKNDWRIWRKDWKPPQEIRRKYLRIDFYYGGYTLFEGDSLRADENCIYKSTMPDKNMTYSRGPG